MWAQTGSPELEAEAQSENEEPSTAVTAVRDSSRFVGRVDDTPVSLSLCVILLQVNPAVMLGWEHFVQCAVPSSRKEMQYREEAAHAGLDGCPNIRYSVAFQRHRGPNLSLFSHSTTTFTDLTSEELIVQGCHSKKIKRRNIDRLSRVFVMGVVGPAQIQIS